MAFPRPARLSLSLLTLSLLAACGAGDATAPAVTPAPLAQAVTHAVRGNVAVLAPYQFAGKLSGFTLARSSGGMLVTDKASGAAVLVPAGVAKLLFDDQTVAIDSAGIAAQAFRLYQAAFDRTPDPVGLGFHISVMEGAGVPLNEVARNFVDSAEFKDRYGALDNQGFLVQLYQNILHRAPDAGGLAYWLGLLESKALTRGMVLASFSNSPENTALVAPAIANGVAYAPYISAGAGSAVSLGAAQLAWRAATALQVVLRDARGQEVPAASLSCSVAEPAIMAVGPDCRIGSGVRLGEQDVLVSGAGVSARLRLKVIPQRQWLGTQSSSGEGSGDYNLLVTPGGNVLAWGANHSLVLGQGPSFGASSNLPRAVADTAGTGLLGNIVSASAGELDAMALTEDGQVMVWGQLNAFGRAGAMAWPSLVHNATGQAPLTGIVQVGVGSANAVALADDGRVYTWGRYAGQGVESLINFPTLPKMPDGSGVLADIVQVAAGFNHSLALGANGKVYAWGWNAYGETGRGTAQTQEPLVATVKLASDGSELGNIVQIVAGYHFSLALAADGRVYAWGDNSYEQLGLGKAFGQHYSAELVKDSSGVTPLNNIVMLAAGHLHGLALDAGGRVLSWGFGADGRLGDGLSSVRAFKGRPMPVLSADGLGELNHVVSIGAGPGHSLALLDNGSVMTWGDGYAGGLGQGTSTNQDLWLPTPVRNSAGTGSLAVSLAAYPNLRNRGR